MMKRKLFLSCLILINFIGIAQNISKDEVLKVATCFLNTDSKTGSNLEKEIRSIDFTKNDTLLVYLVHDGRNFVLIANDLRIDPILGYSTENSYREGNYPPQLIEILKKYENEILKVKRGIIKVNSNFNKKWDNYLKGDFNSAKVEVNPIIDVNWNQGTGWNRFCPEDADGPGGHAYAGCVAVSMAQAMSVFEHPDVGVGESSYLADGYGYLSVNYGETEYSWDLMSKTSADDYNSLFIYHCAVSVNMDFGPDGSGAYTANAANAMRNHFDYSKDLYYAESTYDDAWTDLLKSELDAGRPIVYAGNNGSETGHAFNLDGYNNSNAFHVNWGWSGSYNGYFQLSSLTPGSHDFSENSKAILNITPKDHSSTDIVLSDLSFRETCEVGSVISLISTVDPDGNEEFIYGVHGVPGPGGNTSYCPFYIDGDSLKLMEKVSHEEYNTLYITLTSEDTNHDVIERDFEIDVLKENYAPSNISLSNTIFDDTIRLGSFIAKLNTIDLDEVDTFTYAFEINTSPDLSKDNDKFVLSNDSLFTNYSFLGYSGNECNIYIKSSDWKEESVTKEFVLTINKTTGGVTDIENLKEIQLYPNPTAQFLNIASNQERIKSVEIYDILGNLKSNVEINDVFLKIDLNGYETGMYLVSIEFENGQKRIHKIVKRR